ncbi:ovalbumin-related protein X-like [Bacillus rossius redtenbacheri]|uniref:ovalbumin-related protein X-like n=1 Tax=Bacillus rossius redtenbacheri TaxID=93214 RepID=UPI002FDE6206
MMLLAPVLLLAGTLAAKTEDMRSVAYASNNFTVRFAQYLKKASPDKNMVFSSVSASTVLAGLAEGAAGNTRAQLLSALGLADDDDLIRSGYRSMIASYDASTKANVTLNMADAFFVATGFTPKASFVSMMRSDFQSLVQTVDFSASPEARINSWVSEHTSGKIQKLYETGDLSPSTYLVLANAVYFKGVWKTSFRKSFTSQQPFHLSSGKTVTVDMMTTTSTFVVYSDSSLGAQVLDIPYSGGELKMVIVLPNAVDGLEKTIQNLKDVPTPGSSASALKYNIFIPKFKITSSIMVDEMIQSFGVTDAFSGSADFSRISDESINLSSVKQKAFLEVNEEGTEAAAVTGAAVNGPGPVNPDETPSFTVDHPFLYFIVHVPTETAVFSGFVVDP